MPDKPYPTLDHFLRNVAIEVLGKTAVGMLFVESHTHPEHSGDTKYRINYVFMGSKKSSFDNWLSFDHNERHDAYTVLTEQIANARNMLESHGITSSGERHLTLTSFNKFTADTAAKILGEKSCASDISREVYGKFVEGERFTMRDVFTVGRRKGLTNDQILDRVAAYFVCQKSQHKV